MAKQCNLSIFSDQNLCAVDVVLYTQSGQPDWASLVTLLLPTFNLSVLSQTSHWVMLFSLSYWTNILQWTSAGFIPSAQRNLTLVFNNAAIPQQSVHVYLISPLTRSRVLHCVCVCFNYSSAFINMLYYTSIYLLWFTNNFQIPFIFLFSLVI